VTSAFGPECSRPSGYGFVLFQSLDSAQRCIETLRKYRNLHPSLSKVVVPSVDPSTLLTHHRSKFTRFPEHLMPKYKRPRSIHPQRKVRSLYPHLLSICAHFQSDSFKTKMEQLQDESSTNLYIEGYVWIFSLLCHMLTIPRSLPLTIDEPVSSPSPAGVVRTNAMLGQTLAALMAPHKIMSSRLFQTRLSHPPRTIAFVRYEQPTV